MMTCRELRDIKVLPVHLVVQVALGHLKDPLVWLDFVEGFQVIPDLVRQKLRHLDDPDALEMCIRDRILSLN